MEDEKVYLEEEIRSEYRFDEIVGSGPALRGVLQQIQTAAPTDSSILIQGETGTGKELVARAIHRLSSRVPCFAIALESCSIKVDLPMPGSPPTKDKEPGTIPPPIKRSTSLIFVRMRGVLVKLISLIF